MRRRRRNNPGQYTYKIHGGRPEAYLQDLIKSGEVEVKRYRNRFQPEQEITEIVSAKSQYGTKIKYSETADYTSPTRFEVQASWQYTPLGEAIRGDKAATLFREALEKEAEWNKNLGNVGWGLLLIGGLWALSRVSYDQTTEVATR